MSRSTIIGKLYFKDLSLQNDLTIIKSFPVIQEEYDEFGTGVWINHSLWNEDGNYLNTQYKDYEGKLTCTTLGDKLSYLREFIFENFQTTHLKMVRSRNLMNGMVIPHRDFVELEKPNECYLRIFIPLESNTQSFHSDEYQVFTMQQGEVWILNAALVHAAANFSCQSRIFLCLDFQFDKPTSPKTIFKNISVYNPNLKPMLVDRKETMDLELYFAALAKVINKDNFRDIVIDLSRLHFFYEFDIKETYNKLISILDENQDQALVYKARHLKKYMTESRKLGERFTFQN